MPKFRKKPIIVEAEQFNKYIFPPPGVIKELIAWRDNPGAGADWKYSVNTAEGAIDVTLGQWIVKGIKGDFYPINNDLFLELYEPIIEETV